MFYVARHADDGHPLWWPRIARPADTHADWVFVRQKFPHHFLVYNCHQWLLFAIQGGEVAPRTQGNLHHVEVIAHHRKGLHLGLTPHGHRGASVDDETVAHIIPAERYISHHRCLHAWERIQAGEQLAAGNKVLASARGIESLADLPERYGDQVKLFALDVTDEAAAANAVMSAIDLFGSLDVVINNAGYGNLSSIEDTPLSEFRAQIETNLFGTIIVTKAALRYFREKKAGHFIQFSSVGGRIGPPGRGPYSAAKWGVEGFSEVLSREVAPLGIKVTIVEPGGFRTDFAGSSTELSEGHPEYDSTVGATARFQRNYNGRQPGDPKKAAQAIIQLTQERNPPLRLLLGSDAYAAVEKNDLARLEEARIWKELSVSTDFETE